MLPDGSNIPVHFQIDGMDLLEQALRMVEAEIEEAGWDQRPTFFVVNRDDEGGIGVQEILWLPPFVYDDPGPGLLHIAQALAAASAADNPISDFLRKTGPRLVGGEMFYGIVAMTEAWMVEHSGPRPEIGPDYEWSGVMPSQHPDRVEVRNGTAVTVDGRVLMIFRKRGGTPEFSELNEANGPIETSGRVVDALRMLCTTFHDQVKSAE